MIRQGPRHRAAVVHDNVADELAFLDRDVYLCGENGRVLFSAGKVGELLGDLRAVGDEQQTRCGGEVGAVDGGCGDDVSEPEGRAVSGCHGQFGGGEGDVRSGLPFRGGELDSLLEQRDI